MNQQLKETVSEWSLQAKLAWHRLRLAMPLAKEEKAAFAQSVKLALPDLNPSQLLALQQRYRFSMRKFNLIKQHLSQLAAPQLEHFIARHVQVEGQEYLDALKTDNKPVIFVTPHYGSFQLGCLKLIQEIGKHKTVNAFYNPPSKNRSSEGFAELFQGLGYGFNALFNDDTAVLKALRVLKRGEALTMMPDVFDISGHALYVPFFGRLVPAMAGTAMFALKSNATVIVGYSCPQDGLDTKLTLGRPLEIERSGNLEADIATLTAAIFRDMEAQIRRSPEHWVYLPNIADLIGQRLPVDAQRGEDWLHTLQQLAPQFAQDVPELAQIMQEAFAPATSVSAQLAA
ncbi:MAG: lysophospholipid acyltransferase family protein [Burkholderiales bacterium]|nr:lysophospholipid acyltransferase family protein [Burkholderiales bacterium]